MDYVKNIKRKALHLTNMAYLLQTWQIHALLMLTVS